MKHKRNLCSCRNTHLDHSLSTKKNSCLNSFNASACIRAQDEGHGVRGWLKMKNRHDGYVWNLRTSLKKWTSKTKTVDFICKTVSIYIYIPTQWYLNWTTMFSTTYSKNTYPLHFSPANHWIGPPSVSETLTLDIKRHSTNFNLVKSVSSAKDNLPTSKMLILLP